jgi:hypothetical protein
VVQPPVAGSGLPGLHDRTSNTHTERIPYQWYLLHELAADIHSGHHVRSSVFIEARSMYRAGSPEAMRPGGEVQFVQGLVDKVSYSYHMLYSAFKRLCKGYAAAERAVMFHDTAARVYQIDS